MQLQAKPGVVTQRAKGCPRALTPLLPCRGALLPRWTGHTQAGHLAKQRLIVANVYQAERAAEASQSPEPPAPVSTATFGPPFATVLDMWPYLAQQHGEQVCLQEPHNKEATNLNYSQAHAIMQQAAAGFQQLGLQFGDTVGLIAESSSRWILADQAAMMAGGCTAVRGVAAMEEVAYILGHAECSGLIIQDAQALARLLPHLTKSVLSQLKFVVVLWGGVDDTSRSLLQQHVQQAVAAGELRAGSPALLPWQEVVQRGAAALATRSWRPVRVQPQDVATVVYTSGTSGHPKGVQLSHANLAYQVNNLSYAITIQPGDVCLSLLPPWHIYQRTCAYFVHACAGQVVITTLRKFKDDLTKYPPHQLVCVPLVLDTLYTRVMAKLNAASAVRRALASTFLAVSSAYVHAKRVVEGVALQYATSPPDMLTLLRATLVVALLRPLHALGSKLVYSKVREALAVRSAIISGGGSLAAHLDTFFEVLGLPVLNGWGLTETSPVIAVRTTTQNVRGTVGLPVPGTEVRVVDPETLAPLPAGQRGLIVMRGPGVMRGYLRDDAATAKAFRAGEGWFDTGDLGWVVPPGNKMSGMVVLTGRAKDTIVLLSGKNIEPQPVEDAVCASPLIKFALLLGQDKRELGMLVFPDLDALEAHLAASQAQAAAGAASGAAAGTAAAAASKPGAAEAPSGDYPLVRGSSPAALEALLLPIINELNAARHDYTSEQHVGHVRVVTRGVLSPEDGTLTRTMKLRRAEVCSKYAPEVSSLMAHLRGPH